MLQVIYVQSFINSSNYFLVTFAKLRKAAVSFIMSVCLPVCQPICPSVRPHGANRLPGNAFYRVWKLSTFRKIYR